MHICFRTGLAPELRAYGRSGVKRLQNLCVVYVCVAPYGVKGVRGGIINPLLVGVCRGGLRCCVGSMPPLHPLPPLRRPPSLGGVIVEEPR